MKTRLLVLFAIETTGFAGTACACLCDGLTIEIEPLPRNEEMSLMSNRIQ